MRYLFDEFEDRSDDSFSKQSSTNKLRRASQKYGVSIQFLLELHEKQKGLCAICKLDLPLSMACVDHCHSSGKVRSWLCSQCNSAIGLLKEQPKRFMNALVYLAQFRRERLFKTYRNGKDNLLDAG